MNEKDIVDYIKKQGWLISRTPKDGKQLYTVETPTKKYITENRLVHPVKIHKEHYRDGETPQDRLYHLKAFHDLLWPEDVETWNHWSERRFETHCENWRFIGHAGGAGIGKSLDMAKIATLFWFSAPRENAVVVASTTLTSLDTRIWGYVMDLIKRMRVYLPYQYISSPNQQIIPKDESAQRGEVKLKRHSMRTMAAPIGTEIDAIRNYIGQHPTRKLMLVLDECPDLAPVILDCVANLEAGGDIDGKLELNGIGNSATPSDLHGTICMPEQGGYDSINIETDYKWPTVHRKGIALYFNPYESPAIHEPDPVKRKRLEKIFPTLEKIAQAKKEYGENSVNFWRMTMGFWSQQSGKSQIFVNEPFLKEYGTHRQSLWAGITPLRRVAGLDPAFSSGGDKCVLRLGVLGQDLFGHMVLDYRDRSLLFDIPMLAKHKDPIETQIADNVIDILSSHNMNLSDVVVDCTGQGRVLGEFIRSRAKDRNLMWESPIKIYSSRSSGGVNKKGTDILVKTPLEIWDNIREYMNTRQICGLDATALYQFSNRIVKFNEKTRVMQLESKQEYKTRLNAITKGIAGSPDEADAAALCLLAAILKYGFHKEQVKALPETPRTFLEEKLLYHAVSEQKAAPVADVRANIIRASYAAELNSKKMLYKR